MADNFIVKDGNGVSRTLRTSETDSIHTPIHQAIGPLTNDQLRASAVPVTGPLTDAQLRSLPVPVSGALNNAELRATAVPVSGPATDAQIRATPIRVLPAVEVPLQSGTLSISAGEVVAPIPLPDGAVGVRLFAQGTDVRYSVSLVDPGFPTPDTFAPGGIAKAGIWTVARFAAGVTTLRLRSSEVVDSSDITPVLIDVEFFG